MVQRSRNGGSWERLSRRRAKSINTCFQGAESVRDAISSELPLITSPHEIQCPYDPFSGVAKKKKIDEDHKNHQVALPRPTWEGGTHIAATFMVHETWWGSPPSTRYSRGISDGVGCSFLHALLQCSTLAQTLCALLSCAA